MNPGNGSAATRAGHPWVLGVRGGDAVRQVPLADGTVILGAAHTCAVVLRGRDIARQHATLQLSPERARLSVFPHAAPAVLNGVQVREAGLAPGDTIQVGDVHLTLHRAEPPTPAIESRGEPAASGGDGGHARDAALALVETLCRWALRGHAAGRADMLALLCGELGAEAGCAFVAERGAGPSCVAAWGDPLPELDEAAAALASTDTVADEIVVARRPGWVVAGFSAPGNVTFGLFLRGPDAAAVEPELLRIAARLFGHDSLRERVSGAPTQPTAPVAGLVFPPDIVVGRSPAMRRLYEELATVVDGQLPVLVLGETGVGKEHIAQVLHDSSPRRQRPFVTINCAAIPAELLEAELFGIERGVATGVNERLGKFREAHGGTLFLDEIGELPLPLQAKLLRVLEERKVQPVGGQAATVDLRIVAATNVPLEEVAAGGRFRLDLFHRLAGFVVQVPPLRERSEDVPLLFDHFLRTSRNHGARLTPQALAALVRHRWGGNIRELRHEAARIAARAGTTTELGLADLSPVVAASFARPVPAVASDAALGTLDEELSRIEAALIGAALRDTAGNVSQAAQRLGISRARLRRRAKELAVERG